VKKLLSARHYVKNVNAIIFKIIQYFNRICIYAKAQKQIYIFTIFVLIHITAGLKSMAYIRLCKIMFKGGITKDEFHRPYYCARMQFALTFVNFLAF